MILACLFLAPRVYAQKTMAMIRKIQGLELLDPSVARELERLTIRVVVTQRDYELMIGNDDSQASNFDLVAIESDVSKVDGHYKFENRLKDVKSQKILTKAGFDNVREEDLIRMFKGGLESLFLPEPEKVRPSKAPPIPPPKAPLAPPGSKPKKVPTTTQLNQPDNYSLDFKKRVMDLQFGVDKQIEKTAEAKKEEENKKNEEAKNQTLSPANAPRENVIAMEEPSPPKPSPSYPSEHQIALGFENRTASTIHNVDTTSKFELLALRANGHFPFSFLKGRLAYSYDLLYGKVTSFPYQVSSPYQAGLFATWMGDNFRLSGGFTRESMFFVNLPTPGEGLIASELLINWLRIKAQTEVYNWKLTGIYGTPFSAQTDYSTLKDAKSWGGSFIHIDVSLPWLVKSWETNIMMEKIGLTTQGETTFTHNETRLALSARRSF